MYILKTADQKNFLIKLNSNQKYFLTAQQNSSESKTCR